MKEVRKRQREVRFRQSYVRIMEGPKCVNWFILVAHWYSTKATPVEDTKNSLGL